MFERKDDDFLEDIRESIVRIKGYTSAMSYKQFIADFKTQDAVVRNLEIIGEATKNISSSLRAKYLMSPGKGWPV